MTRRGLQGPEPPFHTLRGKAGFKPALTCFIGVSERFNPGLCLPGWLFPEGGKEGKEAHSSLPEGEKEEKRPILASRKRKRGGKEAHSSLPERGKKEKEAHSSLPERGEEEGYPPWVYALPTHPGVYAPLHPFVGSLYPSGYTGRCCTHRWARPVHRPG